MKQTLPAATLAFGLLMGMAAQAAPANGDPTFNGLLQSLHCWTSPPTLACGKGFCFTDNEIANRLWGKRGKIFQNQPTFNIEDRSLLIYTDPAHSTREELDIVDFSEAALNPPCG